MLHFAWQNRMHAPYHHKHLKLPVRTLSAMVSSHFSCSASALSPSFSSCACPPVTLWFAEPFALRHGIRKAIFARRILGVLDLVPPKRQTLKPQRNRDNAGTCRRQRHCTYMVAVCLLHDLQLQALVSGSCAHTAAQPLSLGIVQLHQQVAAEHVQQTETMGSMVARMW